MTDIKTKQHDGSVKLFLQGIEDGQRYTDCMEVCNLMQVLTGEAVKCGNRALSDLAHSTTSMIVVVKAIDF